MDIKIKRKADGTRYVRPYMGKTPDGRVRRPYHEFPDSMSDAEVEQAARRWLAEIQPGYDAGAAHYVGDLLERYISHMEQSGRAGNSVRSYRTLVRHCGDISHMPARSVGVLDIERMYERLMSPKDEGGAALGASTVVHLHWFLSGAFTWMLHYGIVDVNPVRDVDKPSAIHRDAQAFDGEDFATLREMLAAQMSSQDAMRREAAFSAYLALNTGMRSGEVCALRRVDFHQRVRLLRVCGTVTEPKGGPVRQPTTKGKRSRSVALSDEVADAIVCHEQAISAGGIRRGPKSPIVSTDGTTFMRPSAISQAFGAMCREAGLKGYRFHSLRHTHASQLLAAGVDMKTVSERLGHADVKTTLEAYAHVLPGRDAYAADLFAKISREGDEW